MNKQNQPTFAVSLPSFNRLLTQEITYKLTLTGKCFSFTCLVISLCILENE